MNPHDLNQFEPLTEDFVALEHELREALRPVDPHAGFADRVLTRARIEAPAQRQQARGLTVRSIGRRVWIPSAIAAMLFVGIAGEQRHQQIEQRRKAEEAQKQFETALQVTDRALEHARQQLQHAGISFAD